MPEELETQLPNHEQLNIPPGVEVVSLVDVLPPQYQNTKDAVKAEFIANGAHLLDTKAQAQALRSLVNKLKIQELDNQTAVEFNQFDDWLLKLSTMKRTPLVSAVDRSTETKEKVWKSDTGEFADVYTDTAENGLIPMEDFFALRIDDLLKTKQPDEPIIIVDFGAMGAIGLRKLGKRYENLIKSKKIILVGTSLSFGAEGVKAQTKNISDEEDMLSLDDIEYLQANAENLGDQEVATAQGPKKLSELGIDIIHMKYSMDIHGHRNDLNFPLLAQYLTPHGIMCSFRTPDRLMPLANTSYGPLPQKELEVVKTYTHGPTEKTEEEKLRSDLRLRMKAAVSERIVSNMKNLGFDFITTYNGKSLKIWLFHQKRR